MPLIHTETNKSPLYCKYCGQHLSRYLAQRAISELVFDCVHCDTVRYEYNLSAKVLPSSAKFMKIGNVRDSVWYHATYRADWWYKKDTYNGPVYIGTKNSAKKRWKDLTSADSPSAATPFWMYKLRLKPGVEIHPRVLVDDYLDYETAEKARTKVVRFTNIFESPGSISLALPGKFVDLLECEELS